MRNPNGPSIEEKEQMAEQLLDMNEDWMKIQETLKFIRQVVSGRCDKQDLVEIKRAINECLEGLTVL